MDGLYRIVQDNNIPIVNIKLQEIKGFSVTNGIDCVIGIDTAKIPSNNEHRYILAHELGHCLTGAFYQRANPLSLKSKCEYRADKWAASELLPRDELVEAFKRGVNQVWELAEYFDVTEELVRKALWFYFDCGDYWA